MGAASIVAARHVVADGDSGEERREVALECKRREVPNGEAKVVAGKKKQTVKMCILKGCESQKAARVGLGETAN